MPPLIELKNVTKVFGGGFLKKGIQTVAVDDISFTIQPDQSSITAIAGESGSGKTTMARLLLGVTRPTTGQVLYKGKDVTAMGRVERRDFTREVQPIFQDPFESYNPFYKVDHVLNAPIDNFMGYVTRSERQRMIGEALEMVGLRPQETLGRFPHHLSGGQRQRVMVARALLLKPRLILADEPVSMVDASLRATILDSLNKLNRELGIAVVYITHDLTTAYQISDNIIIMYRGSIAEAGSVEKVIRDPKHPYTQLLIESIPQPDPDRSWGQDEAGLQAAEGLPEWSGCKFADRCSMVMENCWQHLPPLYAVDDNRTASCFLYKDGSELPDTDVAKVFVERSDQAEEASQVSVAS